MEPSKRPTISDVARIAGVSTATVSYVLSGHGERAAKISPATTNRVLEVVGEVGYHPNQSARTLRLRRTNRVLFLGSRLTSLYAQSIARSIEAGLDRHGLALNVEVGTDATGIRRAIAMLGQAQADGLIVEAPDASVPELRGAAASGHAIVAIGSLQPDPLFDVVSVDDGPAVDEAMRHLVSAGYRRFVLLSSLAPPLSERRVAVAHGSLRSLGIPDARVTLLHCPHDRIGAYETAMAMLPEAEGPLAVYAGADVSAIGVLWACHRLGRRVPEEVAIVGHGNSPETRITMPSLTSLGPVRSDFGREAADLMASRLRDRSRPGRYVAEPCRLHIRASSAPGAPPS